MTQHLLVAHLSRHYGRHAHLPCPRPPFARVGSGSNDVFASYQRRQPSGGLFGATPPKGSHYPPRLTCSLSDPILSQAWINGCTSQCALLIALHGYQGNAAEMELDSAGMRSLFQGIIVYPSETASGLMSWPTSTSNSHWAANLQLINGAYTGFQPAPLTSHVPCVTCLASADR